MKAALFILVFFAYSEVLPAVQPTTIPAFKQWTDAPGTYSFSATSQIVLDEAYASQLTDAGATFASDLQVLTGSIVPVVSGLANSKAGDITMTLGVNDSTLGQEGYLLTISDRISISAQGPAGVFYGTRSVLQMLMQGNQIQAGSVRDWPDYPERGLMVDLGRKYFSIPFLQRHIKDLAFLKLNYFHFHLSDTFGFRLESTSHPEITSPQFYSKADIQALLALAQSYHVMIVPEIDFPAHATAILGPHPELQLPNNPDKLDLGNPGSYTLVNDLLQEYLPLFPAPYWHTGGDEYLAQSDYANYPELLSYAQQLYGPTANAQDIYIGFVDWVDGIVKSQGKQLRAWNDVYGTTGSVKTPNSDIVMDMWTNSISANDALSKGHTILNCNYATLYFVLGRASSDQADPVNLYEKWAPNLEWPNDFNLAALTPGVLGGKFHVWCDSPDAQTEDEVQTNIANYLRSLAQNGWGSPKLVSTYDAFTPLIDQVGHTPGFGPDFTMSASPQSATVSAGQTASYTLKLTPLVGFSQSVALSCTINAPESVCGVSSSPVTLNGSTASTITVSVSTTGSSLSSTGAPWHPAPWLPYPYVLASFIIPAILWRSRGCFSARRMQLLRLSFAGVIACCLAGAACGGSGSTVLPITPTPSGNYTVVVQGASGSIIHQTTLSLTVQ